jgi:RND family efflux transporter MFP subunit
MQHVTLIALALLVVGCGHESDTAAPAFKPAVAVETVTLATRALPDIREVAGDVVAENRVQAASRLMGYIRAIPVEVGQTVQAGQVLFSVDPADIEGQTRQAQAGLAQAEAMLADAQTDFERMRALLAEEVASRAQFDKAKLQRDSARAGVDAAQAALGTARAQMRYATVTSPLAGVVTQKLAKPGDLATPGQPVVVVEDPARVQVEAQASSDLFMKLRVGQRIGVAQEGGAEIAGTLAHAVPVANAATRTHLIKIALPSRAVPVGAYVKLRIVVGERDGLSVPRAALVKRAGVSGVFVAGPDQRAHFRLVRTGAALGEEVEVQAGLSDGERVIVRGMAPLMNGDPVQAKDAARG